jgi:hypothetical protein
MKSPQQRVAAIKLSIRIWRLGFLSLIPFVGVGPILSAVITLWHLRTLEYDWNPGRSRLIFGIVLISLGAFISLACVAVALLKYSEEISDLVSRYNPFQ